MVHEGNIITDDRFKRCQLFDLLKVCSSTNKKPPEGGFDELLSLFSRPLTRYPAT